MRSQKSQSGISVLHWIRTVIEVAWPQRQIERKSWSLRSAPGRKFPELYDCGIRIDPSKVLPSLAVMRTI